MLRVERLAIAAHQFARRKQRGPRLGGERLRLGERVGAKLFGGQDGVDEADLFRALRVKSFAEQQKFRGARRAEAGGNE